MSIIGIDLGTSNSAAAMLRGGRPSEETGGVPGDLLVVVRSRPDPRFERHGADLWRAETVPVVDAVLGGTRPVPTLEGSATVTIHGEIKREEETGEHYYQEMSVGPFSRTIRLPAAVDATQVKVRLKHGILEMTMPKTEAEKRHKIAIEEG